jgi:hypothetical protein
MSWQKMGAAILDDAHETAEQAVLWPATERRRSGAHLVTCLVLPEPGTHAPVSLVQRWAGRDPADLRGSTNSSSRLRERGLPG